MTSSPVFNAASSVATVRLQRNAHGRLVLTLPDGTQHADVVPVRAFPIAAPAEGISLVGTDGHELQWIEHLDHLPAAARALVEEDLNAREFVPILQKLVSVSGFSTPSTWSVETDRGPAQLVLKAEEDIRRLGGRTTLLIASADGVQFRVPDVAALDKPSRRLLERFL
ncbi:cyanophycin metabolism-associated DUF1854 family protein [Acidovorax sp. NCPPB 3576]|uniref:cyanophycin metabolism-associated DUF1854 family protein n=1 Tax=Acidovorax sp. NCPPB 3576 TaxID=2940488 RepID=UPI00234BD345|nr:DUF1854 domain-containing protein [Acidovorax sp. NCPPB 3576]WCM89278.1 DUF1854 domain-containing protein [Acidovorax sp. NCPPB 3576]